MKKYYLIKVHYSATELVTISQGREIDYYYGKHHQNSGFLSRDYLPSRERVEVYGFTSLEDANKELYEFKEKAARETAQGYWVASVSIEEVVYG